MCTKDVCKFVILLLPLPHHSANSSTSVIAHGLLWLENIGDYGDDKELKGERCPVHVLDYCHIPGHGPSYRGREDRFSYGLEEDSTIVTSSLRQQDPEPFGTIQLSADCVFATRSLPWQKNRWPLVSLVCKCPDVYEMLAQKTL